MQRVGSRRQVWHITAKQTSGGLTRSELFQDKYGNLKSRKASKKAKKNKNLMKAGWTFKKGSFGAVAAVSLARRTGRARRMEN